MPQPQLLPQGLVAMQGEQLPDLLRGDDVALDMPLEAMGVLRDRLKTVAR